MNTPLEKIQAKASNTLLLSVNTSAVQPEILHCTKKWSFPVKISLVNVTKFEFGHNCWRNSEWKTPFFVHCYLKNDAIKGVYLWILQNFPERLYSLEHLCFWFFGLSLLFEGKFCPQKCRNSMMRFHVTSHFLKNTAIFIEPQCSQKLYFKITLVLKWFHERRRWDNANAY